MKILIAGDLFVTNSNISIESLDKQIEKSDYFLLNLEAPIVQANEGSPILKGGPNLSMKEEYLSPFFGHLNKIIFSGANNHIGDFGKKGVEDTLEFFNKNNITHIGCGETLKEAAKPLFLKDKVVLLAIAENEFGMATKEKGGANPFRFEKNLIQIRELFENGYTVIVYFHGGTEGFSLPNPFIKRTFQSFIDFGAKVVVGNHTHTPQGYERYKKGLIFYSLGNFMFDNRELKSNLKSRLKEGIRELIKGKPKRVRDFWNISYLVSLTIIEDDITFEILPVTYKDREVVLMSGEQRDKFFDYLGELNIISLNDEEYLKYWNAWVVLQSNFVQKRISNFSYSDINFKYSEFLSFQNQLRCESHRELLIYLNALIENKHLKDYRDVTDVKFLQNPDNFGI